MSYDIYINRGEWGSKITIEPPISDSHAELLAGSPENPVHLSDEERSGRRYTATDRSRQGLDQLHSQAERRARSIEAILRYAGVPVTVHENHAYKQALLERARANAWPLRLPRTAGAASGPLAGTAETRLRPATS